MIFVICGAGGVGKGTVVAAVVAGDRRLWLSRSWTTRPRRDGEAEDAYSFVDEDRFTARVQAGGFLEWTRFPGTGHCYGTPTPEPPSEELDVLLEIDLDGAHQVKTKYPDAVVVLIVAPSPEEQQARMRARGDTEDHIRRRIEVGAAEEAEGRLFADHVVVNDDVHRAAAEVAGIIASRRLRAGPRP